jgi:outer membrane protein
MYQRTLHAILVLTFLALPAFAQGSENGKVAGFKIGVVNIKDVFDGYQKQKDRYAALEKERVEAQVPIDEMSAKIEADKKRYDENAANMSEAERRELRDSIERAFTEYQTEFKRRQDEIDRKEKRLAEEVFADIYKAIEEIGLSDNYHLIFEAGVPGRTAIPYYSTTLNMTPRVVQHLNDNYQK